MRPSENLLSRVNVIATPVGNFIGSKSELLIVDDDFLSNEVSLAFDKSSLPEKNGRLTGSITRSGELRDELTVNLFANSQSAARVPLFVVIPAFQSTAQFHVNSFDDSIVNTGRVVQVTASVFGKAAAQLAISVVDNEVPKDPVITWNQLPDFIFGTPLSTGQLNAQANVSG